MKLRTTTPASISIATKVALVFFSLLMIVAGPIQMVQKAFADQYDDKIQALQSDIKRYQAAGEQLSTQATTLQSALDQLANQKAEIQAQININQVKYDKLIAQIADTEKQIKDNQDALGVTVANMYVDDKITPIEMLAGSETISEYMDKQEYRTSIRDQLSSTISKIKDLKASLDSQKSDVAKVLADQTSQRDSLVAKESEQQYLLQQTQGQEAEYQQMISSSQAAITEAKATQAMINKRASGSGGYTIVNSGLFSGYPWNQSNCPFQPGSFLSYGGSDGNGDDGGADGQGGDGYGCRQCASYVAWRIAKETGKYYYWGNAKDFTQNAINAGYQEGGPQAGSIAVMDSGSYGHVAWVEAVNGRSILISQYNWDYGAGYGMFSEMWVSSGIFDHYVHIK